LDYVDWVHRVMNAFVAAWRAAGYSSKGIGFEYHDVFPLLKEGVDSRAAEFQGSTLHMAVLAAMRDLQEIGWLEDDDSVKVTERGESFPDADITAAWRPIMNIQLSEEEGAVLNAAIEASQKVPDDHVLVEEVDWQDIFRNLGWDTEAQDAIDRADFITDRLENKGLIRKHAPLGEIYIQPRYVGFVRATRVEETEDAELIRQLVGEGETTNNEIKRELQLATKAGKAKFISRMMGLATTNVSGRSFMIVGFDDKTRELYGSIDSSITEDRMEQILHEYCQPPLDIKFKRVPMKSERVGLIEVVRHAEHIPYRVVKQINGPDGINLDDVYVRHGSRTEPPTDAELADLIEEGRLARERRSARDSDPAARR
jgi:hypothetical protein